MDAKKPKGKKGKSLTRFELPSNPSDAELEEFVKWVKAQFVKKDDEKEGNDHPEPPDNPPKE